MGCGSSVQSSGSQLNRDGLHGPVPSSEPSDYENGHGTPGRFDAGGGAQYGPSASGKKGLSARGDNGGAQNEHDAASSPAIQIGAAAGLVGSEPLLTDPRAMPEHFYLIFSLWPVVRPGVPEFLRMLSEKKKAGLVHRIYIYTANTSLHWVRFIMQCIMQYYAISLDTFDGIKHAPGGLKVVPDGAVLYDDHPENAIGNCIAVDPYTNEIPWEILGPILQKLPDHTEASCPLWDECGGLQKFVERDQQYEDPPHNEVRTPMSRN